MFFIRYFHIFSWIFFWWRVKCFKNDDLWSVWRPDALGLRPFDQNPQPTHPKTPKSHSKRSARTSSRLPASLRGSKGGLASSLTAFARPLNSSGRAPPLKWPSAGWQLGPSDQSPQPKKPQNSNGLHSHCLHSHCLHALAHLLFPNYLKLPYY